MKTRRELLILGGSSAAAVAVPSFLPNTRSIAFAKGDKDPILAEIASQFQRAVMGLGSNPPKGNAHQLASLYRMMAAWGKANDIDKQLRKAVNDAIGREGHHAFVTKVGTFDWVKEAKQRGYPVPPNMRNSDPVQIAQTIGLLKAGASVEQTWRQTARKIEKNAERFDRQMAVVNGPPADRAAIRLIQDSTETYPEEQPDTEEFDATCTQNPDGTFSCAFVAKAPTTAPNGQPPADEETCMFLELYMAMQSASWMLIAIFFPELYVLGILMGIGWEYYNWFIGC